MKLPSTYLYFSRIVLSTLELPAIWLIYHLDSLLPLLYYRRSNLESRLGRNKTI